MKSYSGLVHHTVMNNLHVDCLKEYRKQYSNAVFTDFKVVSYAVVFGIVALTLVVVFMPMLLESPSLNSCLQCETNAIPVTDDCGIVVVESIPDNLTFPHGSPSFTSTFLSWSDLIDSANDSIDIASYYWTLRGQDVIQDPSDWQGEEIFKKLKLVASQQKVKLRIVMNKSTGSPDNDTAELAQAGAEVRSIDFPSLLGSGILHTKLWIVDKKHFYVGSANMDWRSLTQVKELGLLMSFCPSMAEDASKLFEVYWYLGKPGTPLPPVWPDSFSTKINKECPLKLKLNGTNSLVYFSSSPLPFCPKGRTNDIDAILDVIEKAQKFIYIAVMDYVPMIVFVESQRFWPTIDNALKRAAIERGVQVKLLGSFWNHTSLEMLQFLRSFQDVSGVNKAVIEIKLFTVPAFTEAQAKIPFARVNHNKYMVTDNAAYVGTSNWSGDYFTSTAGVGFIVNQTQTSKRRVLSTVQQQLVSIFDRDWSSTYATPI